MTSVTEWQRALRSADLPHHVKATLYILSTYADWTTGEHARPGERLQDDCNIPRKTAYNHIKAALAAGWLVQTYNGGAGSGRKKWANEYRLTLPVEAIEHVSPVTHALEGTPKHVSPVADAMPEHGSPVADGHGSPVTRHLDIEPSHKTNLDYIDDEVPPRSSRAKGDLPEWDGDVSVLVPPPGIRLVPGMQEYFVRADGTCRLARGRVRPDEVFRVKVDFLAA
jgi:hypothetical protein